VNRLFSRYWGAGLLIITAIVLLLWKTAARFGRARPWILATGRSADEFIYSMACLFQQAGIKNIVLDNLWHSLVVTMSDITGLPADTPVPDFIPRLTALTGRDYQPIIELYRQGLIHQDQKYVKIHLWEVARALDEYRKELTEWKRSSLSLHK
jgi:hypothetical protein